VHFFADTVTLDDFDADDFSDGVFGDSASSRARALAQQRELQLKKRADAAQTSGMIRSSIDGKSNSPVRLSSEQFTPAVRQFSAPKSFKDSDDFDTEFGPKKATRVIVLILYYLLYNFNSNLIIYRPKK